MEPSDTPVEPTADRSRAPATSPPRASPRIWWIVVAAIVLNLLVVSIFSSDETGTDVPYSVLAAEVRSDNVSSLTAKGDSIEGEFREPIPWPNEDDRLSTFRTERPVFADDGLLETLQRNGAVVSAESDNDSPNWFMALLVNFGPALLIIGGYLWLMRRVSGPLGGITSIGRSRAVRSEPGQSHVTFGDVAGIDEAKDELVEIVDYLRAPERYRRLGARAPRGVLLMGPPGTGKTLLAKAVAGEARVPFFSMSAAEFIEMIVGVGASRVRDLFTQAKSAAPSIVFIDELDAIGRARGGFSGLGGVDEREQTLNQILTEMDGFSPNEGVIVLAATNRPDVLDPALLRAGRFDRRIVLNPPDLGGRRAILAVHARDVPLDTDTDERVDMESIAATTSGMVGADLANLVNEAALMAARRGHDRVTHSDFTGALERIVLGAERKIMLSIDDRRRIAYHEAGHALIGMLQEAGDPVRKVSIIPRGRALGVTFQSPISDRYGMSETYLRGRVTGALGGRAAELLVFGDHTTGAESDLEECTAIARQMVGRWGMSSEIGPISVLPEPGADATFVTLDPRAPSEDTRRLVDRETRRIVDEGHDRAVAILVEHRPQLDALATALLARETLDEEDAYSAAGVPHRRADD